MVIFPLQEPTNTYRYDYQLKRDVLTTTDNMTAFYLIGLEAMAVFAWWASMSEAERSVIRNLLQILHDPRSSSSLSNHNVILPCKIQSEELMGEFSIGMLLFGCVYNVNSEWVFLVAVANDNYATSQARQQFSCPIISISSEFSALESAKMRLPPSERRSFTAQYKAVKRKMADLDPELRGKVIEVPEKQLEEEQDAKSPD